MTSYTPFSARVLTSEPLNASTNLLSFDCSVGARPGQFVNLWLPGVDEKPYSVAADDGTTLRIAVCAVGPVSRRLAALQPGDRIGIRGPYGTTFTTEGSRRIVLVGGGFGSAPLHFLGTQAQRQGAEVTIIIGARTQDLLMYLDICAQSGFRVIATTDDGSFGEPGRVTDPLRRLLEQGEVDLVQTCGPEKMMEAVVDLCHEHSIPCELSIERYMKCGFGICGQCACDGAIVCRDGCIFTGEAARQLDEFGKYHRDKEGRKVSY